MTIDQRLLSILPAPAALIAYEPHRIEREGGNGRRRVAHMFLFECDAHPVALPPLDAAPTKLPLLKLEFEPLGSASRTADFQQRSVACEIGDETVDRRSAAVECDAAALRVRCRGTRLFSLITTPD